MLGMDFRIVLVLLADDVFCGSILVVVFTAYKVRCTHNPGEASATM
jgi:hypothetical protein